LVWSPGEALITEHINWHTEPCDTNGGRHCVKRGEDFLRFHTDYLNRLREAYDAQGLTASISPWYTLPPEMKDPANGWTTSLQNAENAIKTLIDPTTGARFASFDRFGIFLEGQYHNALHGIARRAYGETIVGGFMSPASTYFFKIHGLIETHKRRFLAGDFNYDSHSDLVVREQDEVSIWTMNGATVGTKIPVGSTADCAWSVGATADLNYDTENDLILHSQQCERTQAWLMQGTTRTEVVELEAQTAGFTLLGSADFNADLRPDLAWHDVGTNDVSIWFLHGTAHSGTQAVDIPSPWKPSIIGDLNDNGYADIVVTRLDAQNRKLYAVLYGSSTGFGAPLSISGLSTSRFRTPSGIGRFHNAGAAADLVMRYLPSNPMSSGDFELRYLTGFSSTLRPNYGAGSAAIPLAFRTTTIQGPR
jgi:hypothetical protein